MGQTGHARDAVNLRMLELIRAAVKESGMSQSQLEEATGIPRSTLGNILSTTGEPRLVHVNQMVRIAMGLGVSPARWMDEIATVGETLDQPDA